jgi:long-subunit fatty acid transport protein
LNWSSDDKKKRGIFIFFFNKEFLFMETCFVKNHPRCRPLTKRSGFDSACLWIVALVLFCLVLRPFSAEANFNEQVAISTKAISLANTVTADPPGLMSVHYNPAGLSLLDEGKVFSNGFTLAHIVRTGRFQEDPNFPGFMDTWGPGKPYNPDFPNDPDSDHGGPDPLRGTEGTTSGNILYVPFYGPISLPAIPAPNLGISHRSPGSRWTFAYANYAAYGGGIEHKDAGDPLRFGCKSLYLQHLIYAAPSVSYQISDTLSVGASIGMGQTSMGIAMDQRSPNELVALTRVIGDATRDLHIPVVSDMTFPAPWLGGGLGPYEHVASFRLDMRDDYSPSFNLGLLWQPHHRFSFGLVYQSETQSEMTGNYIFHYSEQFQRHIDWNGSTSYTMQGAGILGLPIKGLPFQAGTVTTTQRFPQRVQAGIMVKPFSRIKWLFDVNWTNWSVIKEDRLQFDQRIHLLQLVKLLGYTGGESTLLVERNLKDTWSFSTGLEFMVSEALSLRLGYEKRPTSLNYDLFDALYFLPENNFYGTGAELRLKNGLTIDLGMGILMADKIKVDNNRSTNMNSTDFTKIVYNPYAGLNYEQDTTIYLASFTITMPLELQMELLEQKKEMALKALSKLKKLWPFGSRKESTKAQ